MSDFLERIAKLSPKRLALLAMELNNKLGRLEQRASDPIAVIGMGCRFPGGANDSDSFWRLLVEGRDAISEVPSWRWDIDAFYDPDPDAPGKMSTRWGGFLDGVEQFDPEFFGISPREAAGMDPQQRILMEVSWEALENAGQSADRLNGSSTGVFVGLCNSDYFLMQLEGGRSSIDAYVGTGNAHSVASGRISYILGLQGPCISVDTGCSASLVAVHLACQSLRTRECRMALAGGVNLILMPDTTIFLSKAHMLSPDGRCKSFDASANGFVRSEGCGVIVLKRLSDAHADGDRIIGVIRGTASNQDGRSNGLTAPNGPSQVAVIREALANAGLQPGDIDLVEAHGTGTALGDPIEARALGEVFGQGRTSESPLSVGSVKSNFGHTESASGIAGLIKVLLALEHGVIPPSLHLKKMNPHIDWRGLSICVPGAATSWNRKRGLRAAGVSSFGFSGTNAHVTVSDPPVKENVSEAVAASPINLKAPTPLLLLPLSARSEPALNDLVRKYLRVFSEKPDLELVDVCLTAGTARSHFEYRLATVAADLPEAEDRLAAYQRGERHDRVRSGHCTRTIAPGVVFMFTGQGSQYPGMGHDLYETQPVFRRELEKCAEILKPLLDKSLLEVLFADENELKDERLSPRLVIETQYTQPALFALEYSLAAMWRSWGVEPSAVVGHSVGEYVAACVAGVFNLEDGLRLIAERARLMATLPGGGIMAAVFADELSVAEAIAAEGSEVTIACINGPANVVISGEGTAVDALLNQLRMAGIKSHRLVVSHAFHSPLMDPILDSFESLAAKVRYSEPFIAIVSNVTGEMAYSGLMSSAAYWRRHIRNPVRFADSVRALREAGRSVFLEIGPQPVLGGMARMSAPEAEIVWASSLKGKRGNWENLLESVSSLYVHGVEIEWTGLHAAFEGKRIPLPTYPFQRQKYWLERRNFDRSRAAADSGSGDGNQTFFGRRLDSPAIAGAVFEIEISVERSALLNDNRIFGRPMMPSSVYIEMALAGVAEVLKLDKSKLTLCEVTDFLIREPIFPPEVDSCQIQLIFEAPTKQGVEFRICRKETSTETEIVWRTHATGRTRIVPPQPETQLWKRGEAWARCSEEIDPSTFYDSLIRIGFSFGDRFRRIVRIRRRDGEVLAEIRLPELLTKNAGSYRIPPALLDSCFHLLSAALSADSSQNVYFPTGIERLTLFDITSDNLWSHVVLRPISESGPEEFSGDIRLYDDNDRLVAEIVGLRLERAALDSTTGIPGSQRKNWFYELQWREKEAAAAGIGNNEPDLTADFILTPLSLAEQAGNQLHALAVSEGLDVYEKSIPKLEALSADFINRAFLRMGWSPRPGENFTTRELADRLGVVSTQRRLFERLIANLAEEGVLDPKGDGWMVLKPLREQSSDLQFRAEGLKQRFPACSAEVTLTARCGERLDEVLRGTCDPLQLLFPGGNFDTADALYRSSPYARALNTAVRHVVVGAIQDAPRDRMIRILEIGAGTGGTTSFLFPYLPAEHTRYAFTDVSPLFLSRARDEFRDYPFASFELLDIEKSLGAQGFGDRAFDLIIAANVLHATRDLRETLANTVNLLAPGGMLILLEGTHHQLWVDLTFGLTEGWWRFDDTVLRPSYPLLSAEKWKMLFEERDLAFDHATAPLGHGAEVIQQAILIGRRPLPTDKPGSAKTISDLWVILEDKKGIAEEVAALISERGEECVLVAQRSDFEFANGDRAALNPLRPEDFTRLFSELLDGREGQLRGVLNLWAMDEEITAETTPSQWEAAQARIGGAVLHVAQAFLSLQAASVSRGARLWLATCQAQAVLSGDSSVESSCQPVQALVWGLARQILLENPEQFGAIVDLDFEATSRESAAAIWQEVHNVVAEDAVAYRDGRRLLPRLVRGTEPQSEPLILRSDGSYLITGGLGTLGLQTASWMAARGAGHIVLLSRRDFPSRSLWGRLPIESTSYEIVKKVLGVEKFGARISIARGDVADEIGMQSLFRGFGKEGPPLKGIVHAAVDMTDGSIGDLNLELFQGMCRAKALGGWILNKLTLDMELDFFVLFSSTAALWGATGLGHLAAADQALNLLAKWRRERGLCALSVNWGTWEKMRIANAPDKTKSGLRPMPGAQALAALEHLISTNQVSAVVASVDWDALRAVYEARRARSLFAELLPSTQPENGTIASRKSVATASEISLRLKNASPTHRRDLLIAHLRSEASSILGFELSREIDLEQGLFDMGMDSLMAMEFKGRLQRSLAVPLPSTLTFNYPTINALTGYLLKETLQLDSQTVPERTVPIHPAAPVKAESVDHPSDGLSEDEISILLMEKLEQMK